MPTVLKANCVEASINVSCEEHQRMFSATCQQPLVIAIKIFHDAVSNRWRLNTTPARLQGRQDIHDERNNGKQVPMISLHALHSTWAKMALQQGISELHREFLQFRVCSICRVAIQRTPLRAKQHTIVAVMSLNSTIDPTLLFCGFAWTYITRLMVTQP